MFIVYLLLLVGIAGGWEQRLTDTPTFILLAGLTMTLFVKEVKKINEQQQRKSTRVRGHSEGD